MISLLVLFWMYVLLFAIIGAMRGWAKEILVTAGVVLALFVITILENYIPFFRDSLTTNSSFWMRMIILGVMTFFGYQGPNIPRNIDNRKFMRDRFGDYLFGTIFGAFNGYMIFGTAWFYLKEANYPFDWITAPDMLSEAGKNVQVLIDILPPQWLQTPTLYYAVAIAFIIILVVIT